MDLDDSFVVDTIDISAFADGLAEKDRGSPFSGLLRGEKSHYGLLVKIFYNIAVGFGNGPQMVSGRISGSLYHSQNCIGIVFKLLLNILFQGGSDH